MKPGKYLGFGATCETWVVTNDKYNDGKPVAMKKIHPGSKKEIKESYSNSLKANEYMQKLRAINNPNYHIVETYRVGKGVIYQEIAEGKLITWKMLSRISGKNPIWNLLNRYSVQHQDHIARAIANMNCDLNNSFPPQDAADYFTLKHFPVYGLDLNQAVLRVSKDIGNENTDAILGAKYIYDTQVKQNDYRLVLCNGDCLDLNAFYDYKKHKTTFYDFEGSEYGFAGALMNPYDGEKIVHALCQKVNKNYKQLVNASGRNFETEDFIKLTAQLENLYYYSVAVASAKRGERRQELVARLNKYSTELKGFLAKTDFTK